MAKPPGGGLPGGKVAASRPGSPLFKEMTLLSRSQGSGLPTTDASVSTRKACSPLRNCADLSANAVSAAQDNVATPVSWSLILDLCPLCGEAPLETVRVDGQMACRSCTSSCTICSSPSVPGEEACTECLNHLSPQPAVPA
jgi:hypothetical protein